MLKHLLQRYIAKVMPFEIFSDEIVYLNICKNEFHLQSGSTEILRVPSITNFYRVVITCFDTQTKLFEVLMII